LREKQQRFRGRAFLNCTTPVSPRSYHTYGGSVEDVTAVKINGVVKKESPVDDLAKWDLTAESVEVRCIALLQNALEH
jgi:hypothetical protein